MEEQSLSRLSALSHPQRLAIFRLLVRRYPDRLAAGEIAQVLDLKPSTLSAYLATLSQAGLVTQLRAGTSLLYAVAMDEVRRTFDWLFLDCCRGRPDICVPGLGAPDLGEGGPGQPNVFRQPLVRDDPMPPRKLSVLFLCSGNSARSIFAEAILRHEAGDRFEAYSAGTQPRSQLNPFAVRLLETKGYDISHLRSKSMAEFQGSGAPRFDFVITVCNRAANEECPAWSGQPISAHWGTPDPVSAEGTDAQKSLAFQQAYGQLRNRITAFAALPFAELDRLSLQRAMDDIGRLGQDVSA